MVTANLTLKCPYIPPALRTPTGMGVGHHRINNSGEKFLSRSRNVRHNLANGSFHFHTYRLEIAFHVFVSFCYKE